MKAEYPEKLLLFAFNANQSIKVIGASFNYLIKKKRKKNRYSLRNSTNATTH